MVTYSLPSLPETEPPAVVAADPGRQILDDDRALGRLPVALGESDDPVVLGVAVVVLGLRIEDVDAVVGREVRIDRQPERAHLRARATRSWMNGSSWSVPSAR